MAMVDMADGAAASGDAQLLLAIMLLFLTRWTAVLMPFAESKRRQPCGLDLHFAGYFSVRSPSSRHTLAGLSWSYEAGRTAARNP